MKREYKNATNTFYFTFDGIADYGDYIRKVYRKNGYSVKDDDNEYWGGSFSQAMKESQYGSMIRVMELKEHIDALNLALVGYKRIMRADVSGPLLDVPAYLAGLPECFRRFDRKPEAPAVNIAVSMGMGGSATASEIYNRMAAIVALVNNFQTTGRKVNLSIQHYKWDDYGKHFVFIDIKINLDPIDLSELAFALSPLCKRRLGFSLLEALNGVDHSGRYGINRAIPKPKGPAVVMIGDWENRENWSNYATPEGAAVHVVEIMEKFNAAENDAVIEG